MKPSSSPARTPSRLSDSVQRHLNMYALAAGAVGLAVLALAQPGKGRIVYKPSSVWIFPSHGSYQLHHTRNLVSVRN
jgi:hypothetical protein